MRTIRRSTRPPVLVAAAVVAAATALAASGPAGGTSLTGAARHHGHGFGRSRGLRPLPGPASLSPFAPGVSGQGHWQPAGRTVAGQTAVYETSLVPPGGGTSAGIAWMDTHLLAARLYSGSQSPGGGPYTYTAPIEPAQARTLVVAFNGGFKMPVAGGGYYTEGRTVVPLRKGAASLVVDKNGDVTVGAWGSEVKMSSKVSSVRQNLTLLVDHGRPTPLASTSNWLVWGATCGVSSCSGTGIEHQWRSGVGVTSSGALVYVSGPGLAPLQLAELLARAGAQRAMQLDINPDWTVLATYDPPPGSPAAPANGSRLVADSVQGPATFFASWWARDFVTMSAR